ncbi:HK97-gp10 family putative phage morphogenesis protein [Clostridioides difficile]|uniref:HK97-gp10 family putative phage morphogenesis protein n=1 Tax=Clostridioides difficile TaxID=1496 RepID=UPI000D1EC929|nr:HK97-gp10 family putative phage morphogenesis protein [Clostridioides difficile]
MSLEFDLSSLTKKLSELEKKVSKDITKKALLEGAEPMEDALKVASPVDTGELRDNIKSANKIKNKKGRTTIDVGVTGNNRKMVERAYYNHYGSRGRAGTYFMDDGFKRGIKPAQQKMVEVLKKELR